MTIKSALDGIMGIVGESMPLVLKVQDYYAKNGMKFEDVNMIGIRLAEDFYTNKFLDVLAIATDSEVFALRATTVPGPKWTPENCKKFGVSYPAVMCLGYHEKTFGFANHRDHPPGQALRAKVKLACYRDNDRDSKMSAAEGPYFEPANSGMDIHAQSIGDTDDAVNFASAGCQVAQSRALFLSRFMPMLYASKEGKKGTAGRFSYFLTDKTFPLSKEFKAIAQ